MTSENKKDSTLSRFLAVGSKPTYETFPELPEAITWMRFVMAIGYGLSLGFNLTQGWVPLLYALNFIAFGPVLYAVVVLQADNDSYGNKLLFAGLHNCIALILLIWIYFYTKHHEQEEQALEGLLAMARQNMAGSDTSGDESSAEVSGGEQEAVPPQEESEF
jgi:hypothetical protein